jgi:hypothetical protein
MQVRGFVLSLVAAAVIAALPASAVAQGPPNPPPGKPCDFVPPGLTGDARAVAQYNANREAAAPLDPGATVVACNVKTETVTLPPGVGVPASPVHGTNGNIRARAAHTRQSGDGTLYGVLYCQMYGRAYYVSSPTYIHTQTWWNCNGIYNVLSGGVIVSTPTHGAWGQPIYDNDNWQGYNYAEFGGIPWYGYNNRAVWEYGYFSFYAYGVMYVQTNNLAI